MHLFRNISQYQQLSSELNENTKVLVIGGGFVGSELAYAMTRTGLLKDKYDLSESFRLLATYFELSNLVEIAKKSLSKIPLGSIA